MKIAIELKESATVDIKTVMKNITGTTAVDISKHTATCNIPREKIAPGGKIDAIFNALGGINNVKSITLQSN